MKALHTITFILLAIGGLNWLLVGLFHKDLFVMLGMGMTSTLPVIVYILVGLSALWQIFTHKSYCKMCAKETQAMPKPMM